MASRYSSLEEPLPPWKTKKTATTLDVFLWYRSRNRTGLLVVVTKLLRDKLLVLAEQLGVELDVARGVNTVDVAVSDQPVAIKSRGGCSYPKPAAMLK